MKLQMVRYGCILMLTVGTIAAGPLGCATTQSATPRAADRQLSAKVQRSLKRDMVYKFSGINVSASNATVQLSGFT